ncbi:S8 family serine peptidase [Streptomyces sp. Go40/10]|uniref:S53 family peptidase n=1 Tax=Streptomyces sp. Go40/10 TaxID=2825844 RepID=UPI001E4107DD|nr:S8 family serine peptidase [Streptomyces sp. Go40/10]UFR03333.1 S8 family serine peptidase [Streptomyces sp. Go40/10]
MHGVRMLRALVTAALIVTGLAAAPATAHVRPSARGSQPPSLRVCPQIPIFSQAACLARLRTGLQLLPSLPPGAKPPGLGADDIRSAYELRGLNGQRRTVAITIAHHDPNLESDLAVYRRQFHLPACTKANGCLRVINQRGGTTPPPTTDPGWAFEESIDVDAVSAACPGCRILVVENDSAFASDMFAGVDQAVAQGAKFISNSWVFPEAPFETNFDFHFNHPGVAFTFGSGDNGGVTQYPPASPYVTAVGGTTLSRANNQRGWTESAWPGTGCGCSLYEPKPPFQHDTICPHNRTIADVSAVAAGFAVYDTVPFGASTGWLVADGTSIAAPLVAGMYALAGNPAPGTFPNSYPYAHPGDFHDITTGSAGSFSAGPGYDAPTGVGTPDGVDGLRSSDPYGSHRRVPAPLRKVETAGRPRTPA